MNGNASDVRASATATKFNYEPSPSRQRSKSATMFDRSSSFVSINQPVSRPVVTYPDNAVAMQSVPNEPRSIPFPSPTTARPKVQSQWCGSEAAADERLEEQELEGMDTSHGLPPAVGARRQGNGAVGSVFPGNKLRSLKKEDGVPLWRIDIQYEFLRFVFEDRTPVFTRLEGRKQGLTFADIYIDSIMRSSKTSRTLKFQLQSDKHSAMSMAMVCLLVNFGRMNTTLCFSPDMRAHLRTYHSIPALQAHHDASAYKQLQDAPRLKSILKRASEDTGQPNSLEKLVNISPPRTNPVNLIFVMSQYGPRISDLHLPSSIDFFDLVAKPTLSSKSRARAFLWLMWHYLESDLSDAAALRNPFGPGIEVEGKLGRAFHVPELISLTEEQAEVENIDPPDEVRFGEDKQRERRLVLEDIDGSVRPAKCGGNKDYASDDDLASSDVPVSGYHDKVLNRLGNDSSSSTPLHPSARRIAEEEDGWSTPVPNGRTKGTKRESSNAPTNNPVVRFGAGSPAPSGRNDSARRPRSMTQHQLAVAQNRKQRIEYMLAQRRSDALRSLRFKRQEEDQNSPLILRARRLLRRLPTDYDSNDEKSWGKGGTCPNPEEEDDFGEAAGFYLSVLRKLDRRMRRWDWDEVLEDARNPNRVPPGLSMPQQYAQRYGFTLDHDTDGAVDSTGITSTTGLGMPTPGSKSVARGRGGGSRSSRSGKRLAAPHDDDEARIELVKKPRASSRAIRAARASGTGTSTGLGRKPRSSGVSVGTEAETSSMPDSEQVKGEGNDMDIHTGKTEEEIQPARDRERDRDRLLPVPSRLHEMSSITGSSDVETNHGDGDDDVDELEEDGDEEMDLLPADHEPEPESGVSSFANHKEQHVLPEGGPPGGPRRLQLKVKAQLSQPGATGDETEDEEASEYD